MDDRHRHVGYETSDTRVGPVAWFLLGLSGVIVACLLAMALLFSHLEERAARQDPSAPLVEDELPPEPRLERNPHDQLDSVLQESAPLLQQYRWIDRDAGVVGIPVERATELILQRGLPVRPQPSSREEGDSR